MVVSLSRAGGDVGCNQNPKGGNHRAHFRDGETQLGLHLHTDEREKENNRGVQFDIPGIQSASH